MIEATAATTIAATVALMGVATAVELVAVAVFGRCDQTALQGEGLLAAVLGLSLAYADFVPVERLQSIPPISHLAISIPPWRIHHLAIPQMSTLVLHPPIHIFH